MRTKSPCWDVILTVSSLWPIAAVGIPAEERIALEQGWTIQSSAKVAEAGAAISSAGFKPVAWFPARVPSTILADLVADHVYSDPYFGTNLLSIPGAAKPGENFANVAMPADSPSAFPGGTERSFRFPQASCGKNLWRHFNGINYRANVWLNGTQVATADKMAGMWRLFKFNVTRAARPGHTNALAVEVFPPTPDSLSITWFDWSPLPPDKNMGIWREVYLDATGPVAVRNPQVVTKLDLPRSILRT